jgi:type II secretory ATPase GspE/PulE/Tfp pilus assembly ATPase PilB-like protein
VEADPSITSALIVRLKLMAQLDIAERRLPQDGRITVKSGDSRFDIRMSTMPTQFGESIVLRLLRQGGKRLGIRDLLPAGRARASSARSTRRTGSCWSPARPAAARPPPCMPRSKR